MANVPDYGKKCEDAEQENESSMAVLQSRQEERLI